MGLRNKSFESNQQVPTIILYIANELIKSGLNLVNKLTIISAWAYCTGRQIHCKAGTLL